MKEQNSVVTIDNERIIIIILGLNHPLFIDRINAMT